MGRYMIVRERREGGEVHDSEGEEGGGEVHDSEGEEGGWGGT